MRFDVLTLFPDMFDSPLRASIVARARDKGLLEIALHDVRDFSTDRHRSVDDTPYGGGGGMVMTPGPLVAAIESVRSRHAPERVIVLSPQGRPLTQEIAVELAGLERIALVCGRYEGIDERVIEGWSDDTISIGDYVLSGGELAAMVVIDAVTRLLPGALGNELGAWEETLSDGSLEYPQYTRPRVFEGREVPEVLLSGDHARIASWRRRQSLVRTRERRPDLFAKLVLDEQDERMLGICAPPEGEHATPSEALPLYIALVHHPVYNRRRETVATAITNLDVHDLARLGRTFGVRGVYIVTPVAAQRELVRHLLRHWLDGEGGARNPRRAEAMGRVRVAPDVAGAAEDVRSREGSRPRIVATGARFRDGVIDYGDARRRLRESDSPTLLLFGTGWGLHDELVADCDWKLAPIRGGDHYNHLAVRTAVGIILDRLVGRSEAER